MSCQELLWPEGKFSLWYTDVVLQSRCPGWIILHTAVRDIGQTCNYWAMWTSKKPAIFLQEQLFKKAHLVSRHSWDAEFGQGRSSEALNDWASWEASWIPGRTWAWWAAGIWVPYHLAKPMHLAPSRMQSVLAEEEHSLGMNTSGNDHKSGIASSFSIKASSGFGYWLFLKVLWGVDLPTWLFSSPRTFLRCLISHVPL